MARLIYACSFDIQPTAGLGPILAAYGEWIIEHYKERRGIKDFTLELKGSKPLGVPPVEGHAISRDRFLDDGGEVVRIQWTYPSENDKGLVWRNEVRLGLFDGCCAVEHLIWIDSVEFTVAPPKINLGSPSIVRQLCTQHTAHIGEMKIKSAVYNLRTGKVDEFLALLESSRRRLPIVFLTPYAEGYQNLINGGRLAQFLAAVGIVVRAVDVDSTWDISDRLGRSLSCFNGGARIYWPGFTQSDDPRRHPLYVGTRIEDVGQNIIARAISRVIFTTASFRYVPNPKIVAQLNKAEHAERIQRVETQKTTSGADWEAYAVELDAELSKAKEQLAELLAENDNLKANQQIYLSGSSAFGDTEEDVAPEPIAVPTSVEAAVQSARAAFHNLVILDSALDSAQDSPFQRPAEVMGALKDLDGVASTWNKRREQQGNGGDIRQHLIDRGWGKRCSMHISDTTRNMYGNRYYKFYYKGERVMFEPHMTLGAGDANSCASIHFIMDQQAGKIVVAHVGRHLPNTKK